MMIKSMAVVALVCAALFSGAVIGSLLAARSDVPAQLSAQRAGPTWAPVGSGAVRVDLSTQAELDTLRGELSLLGDRLSKMREELIALEAGLEHASDILAEDSAVSEAHPNEEDYVERARQAAEARMAHIEQYYELEMPDSDWSDMAEELIHETLSSEALTDVSVLGVDCRTTLCRVELLPTDLAEEGMVSTTLALAVGHMLPKGAIKRIDDGGGRSRTVVYLAREGHALPAVRREGLAAQ